MKQIFRYFLMIICLTIIWGLTIAKNDQNPNNQSDEIGEVYTGTINAIDIQDHKITLNGKEVALADKIKIVDSNNMIVSLLALRVDQEINYWASSENKTRMITKIRIITGYNPNAFKQ